MKENNMLYNVKWLEKKNNDWIVAQLVEGATNGSPMEYKDVSINRVNKKGETFPNFDDIQPGGTVEGELWKSDAGKMYLFAPREPKRGNNGAYKQKMIEDTMNKKEASISQFQTNKEESIKLASAQRDAVLIVTSMVPFWFNSSTVEEDLKEEIIRWRNWFLSNKFTKDIPPF